LRFLEQYLAIEQVRFCDRLRTTVDVNESLLDAAVPAFVLQPLVENALRHGVAKRSDAGRVEIVGRRDGGELVLSVRDDGAGLDPHDAAAISAGGEQDTHGHGNGVGLANTRERLTTLYGDRARLDLRPRTAGGAIATVRLPYRRYVPPTRNPTSRTPTESAHETRPGTLPTED
jgi:LytS/YehU family sensor histidine kinase